MKNYKMLPLFILFAANILRGQEPVSALFLNTPTPDSTVRITTLLPGATHAQALTVDVTDGWARIEGDIVLGRIEELQQKIQDRGIALDGNQFRWPGAVIPYTINNGFTPQYLNTLRQAIEYINGATHLNIRPFLGGDTRWIVFNPSNVCESSVGMQNYGGQTISLMDPYGTGNNGTGCYFPQIIHEIAHAAGLWHEQSREDRNNWVTIQWGNIQSGKEHNFNQHISDGIDVGPYDLASNMHYGPLAFSRNGQPTITASNGQAFGNTSEYSPGDVAAINWMYPVKACVPYYNPESDLPSVSRPLHYETSGFFSARRNIPSGSQVTFDARLAITLTPGFTATSGCTFRAVIDGCGGAVQSIAGPDEQEWILEAGNQQPAMKAAEPIMIVPANTGETAVFSIAPNPFTTATTIAYTLPADTRVDIRVFNLTGVLVATLVPAQQQSAGEHRCRFEAQGLPPGVYMLVVQVGAFRMTKRLLLTR